MVHHLVMTEQQFHQFKLRLPLKLFMKLEGDAARESRSVSSEIVKRLEDSYSKTKLPDEEIEQQRNEFARGHTSFALSYLMNEIENEFFDKLDPSESKRMTDLVQALVDDMLWKVDRRGKELREDLARSPAHQYAQPKARDDAKAPPTLKRPTRSLPEAASKGQPRLKRPEAQIAEQLEPGRPLLKNPHLHPKK